MKRPKLHRLPGEFGLLGTVVISLAIVLALIAALYGGFDLFALSLLGRVPQTPAGLWSVMAATALSLTFAAFNRAQALKHRPSDLLQSVFASRVVWSIPLVLALTNAYIWSSEGWEAAIEHALLSAAATATFISVPIASYKQLGHAERFSIFRRESHYLLEGKDSEGMWRVVAKIEDDVIALSHAQEDAIASGSWSSLRLSIETCRCRVVEHVHVRGDMWDHTNLLANGKPDEGLGKAS